MDLVDTVVVFGDSLSDIGTKWKTLVGGGAWRGGAIVTSPTGRFSDCRNWTDFMYEAASGSSLITNSAEVSILASQKHHRLSTAPNTPGFYPFRYANYAMGGACGISHHGAHLNTAQATGGAVATIALSTFASQVDKFKDDVAANSHENKPLGDVLFLIWFGANDLYTANCDPNLMDSIAEEVANKQRHVLNDIVRTQGGKATFLFMDLAYPLSSVRYSARLKEAKDALKRAILTSQNPTARTVAKNYLGGGRGIQNLASLAQQHDLAPKELKAYEEQVASIKALETGVYAFNSKLCALTGKHGDGVVKLAKLLNPELLKRLVLTSHRLKRGAATYQVPFMTSWQSDEMQEARFLSTRDQAHPTDPVYGLIWEEIYRGITKANITFGRLRGFQGRTTLRNLRNPGGDNYGEAVPLNPGQARSYGSF
jgi:hypothetical protein